VQRQTKRSDRALARAAWQMPLTRVTGRYRGTAGRSLSGSDMCSSPLSGTICMYCDVISLRGQHDPCFSVSAWPFRIMRRQDRKSGEDNAPDEA
jgi:hypothetical protein